jgi:ribosome-binding factor A
MPNNYRLAKVSSLLKKEITLILQNDLENDLIRDHFVNISKIDLSGDLQHCKIYIKKIMWAFLFYLKNIKKNKKKTNKNRFYIIIIKLFNKNLFFF